MRHSALTKPVKFTISGAAILVIATLLVSFFWSISIATAIHNAGWLLAGALSIGALVMQVQYDDSKQSPYNSNIWFLLCIGQIVLGIGGGVICIIATSEGVPFLSYAWGWAGIFCTGTFLYSAIVWAGRWVLSDNTTD